MPHMHICIGITTCKITIALWFSHVSAVGSSSPATPVGSDSLVSSPDPTPSAREKGSGDYGPFSWLCFVSSLVFR